MLTELGQRGWDVDIRPTGEGMSLLLTVAKNGLTLRRVCDHVVDAAYSIYGEARTLDAFTRQERFH